MEYINKKLQISKGSYGTLSICGNDRYIEFNILSYVNCGGRHQHNIFEFKTDKDAVKTSELLYAYGTSRKRPPKEPVVLVELEQQYTCRGEFRLTLDPDGGIFMQTGSEYSGGRLTLSKAQARKVAGYLMYWVGSRLIGTRTVRHPARTEQVFDITDKDD